MAKTLYISGMGVQMPEDHEGYFFGKHSTGYGNVWNAFFGNCETFILKHMQKCIQEGDVCFKQDVGENKYAGIVYPEKSPISVMTLIKLGEDSNEVASQFPLLLGMNNEVKLKESYPWDIDGEGEMAAETDLGKVINFHNPYFTIDNNHFKADKIQTISLAGLAMKISELEVQEFPAKGDCYDHFLEEFLKENPNKTEKDFEAPIHRIDAEHFRMFVPTDYCCEFEIATQIEEIEHIEVLGEEFVKLKVNLEHTREDEYLYCNIYASEHVLGKYKPQVGDGISAIIWLTGFFN